MNLYNIIGIDFLTKKITFIIIYMDIQFETPRIEKIASNAKELSKKYGKQANVIQKRLMQLQASPTMLDFAFDRPHSLSWDYAWCIAIDLKHPYRMIVRPLLEFDMNNWSTITTVEIVTLYEDYH